VASTLVAKWENELLPAGRPVTASALGRGDALES